MSEGISATGCILSVIKPRWGVGLKHFKSLLMYLSSIYDFTSCRLTCCLGRQIIADLLPTYLQFRSADYCRSTFSLIQRAVTVVYILHSEGSDFIITFMEGSPEVPNWYVLVITCFWGWFGKNQPEVFNNILKSIWMKMISKFC